MKTDINGCSTSTAGTEHYEKFKSTMSARSSLIQYDYRDADGALFSTVAKTLEIARERRDKWLANRA
jgi:hypothetical protein